MSARDRIQVLLGHLKSPSDQLAQPMVTAGVSKAPGPQTKKYGGHLVAQTLKESGITHVFTLTGGHIAPILVGCNQVDISVIDVRDEAAAVFAADAAARLSGLPGIAIVTAGPGLTNTITAVKNAQLAESPVVIMAGATAMILKGRGSLQDIDQQSLMRPHVKQQWTIKRVRDIVPIVRAALHVAASGVPGPVFIEYPIEVLWPQDMMAAMVGTGDNKPKSAAKSESITDSWTPRQIQVKMMARMQEWYLKRHFDNVFANAFDAQPPAAASFSLHAQSQTSLTYAPSAQLAACAMALCNSKRPLILLGSQSTVRTLAAPSLRKAIEALGVPTFCSGMARGLLGAEHALQLRHKRKEALADADFILLAGSIVDFRVDYGRHFAKQAHVVMVNLGLEALGKNSDIRARQQAVRADPCAFVVALAQQHSTAKVNSTWTPWLQKLRQNDARRETDIDKMAAAGSAAKSTLGLNPVRVCRAINQAMAEDSIIVADGGDFVGTASYIVRPRQPHGWLDPGVFGTLGVGGGFAVAAKALRPKSEVWILFGDGSCAWSLSEVDTMVRHQLPCIIVIGNDAAWQQMRRDQVRLLGDPVASELLFTRYDTVGAGYGAHGILVDRESDLETALSEAKRVVRDERRPVVVNVMIAKSSFREGSISL